MNWKSFVAGIFTVLVLIALGGGGYYLGARQSSPDTSPSDDIEKTAMQEEEPKATPTPSPSPTPTGSPVNLIEAGGVQSFPEYTISVPTDWQAAHDHDEGAGIDELILTSEGYEIQIYQAASGGSQCLYPNDNPFDGPSATYEAFVPISGTNDLTWRRSGEELGTAYTVCQMQEDGSFFAPTIFGHISFEVPQFDENMLAKMDAVISTLQEL